MVRKIQGNEVVLVLALLSFVGISSLIWKLDNMAEHIERAKQPQQVKYSWQVGPKEKDTFTVTLEAVPGQSDASFRRAFTQRVDEWQEVYPPWKGGK